MKYQEHENNEHQEEMEDLSNQTAIITGASSGIGAATAKLLAGNGASVALAARSGDKLQSLQEDIQAAGGEAISVETDVTEREQLQNLAGNAKEHFGSIDILVNNAGLMPLSYMKKLHVDEWDKMIDVNIKGVLYSIAAVLPVMVDQQAGHIVNISSVDGRMVYPGGAVYCATKYAVRALTDGLRQELSSSDGIRLTCIEPGTVDTPLAGAITDEDIKEATEKQHRGMEMLHPGDIAHAILYAVSQPDRVDVSEIQVMPTDQQ
jgi:NADP-dependent 3-hydroxy acid dehydrogenase YdfG